VRVISVANDGFDYACAALRRNTLQDNPAAEATVREIVADVRVPALNKQLEVPKLKALPVAASRMAALACANQL